ncbi:bifunctional phosphopantothenoylcysteine decarboxylase/phosphopantothenate--cysteine ligase CoaBC [Ammoniphilus sp. CFH 90114]|uniref:bifunctional phosphopantothenoylcysteine decarboxylase/phosphopantothenate--cysteine ligase CoaBC n=1 Tax=Ammoniphilus sp. CFH 90114 TaxID=2493665 RepID=UPI00100FFBF9|nr:bifunctional phosphopantothenoylcysteine decarboxylase/phosphopantothenate--cysteine ligase CoaBC [Ammoniphilus sp. CFH 90114]RXT15044.1 bifunctional phosphopantothenoylcysteine decarboxylase/phosphopantothenate--cysteine ligase CoaBC [Ammoniphilus sp. CFH 90114]
MLQGKTIVLGVTGGIAAYKAAALCSALVQRGADVRVILSSSALQFIQPLTFQALSRNHVMIDTFEEKDPTVISHIDLADQADLIVVAPATANFLGKAALGLGDDMLSTTLLATRAPVMVCPAMNVHMYQHPAVQHNMELLRARGVQFVEPGEGFLACGYVGKGRMAEPEEIVDTIIKHFTLKQDLVGKKLVITAGATREAVDPVRFFTNRSTGKMGYALAEAASRRGAKVILVSGKSTSLPIPPGVEWMPIESADDMYQAVVSQAHDADMIIKAAAVADYRPAVVHEHKLKKKEGNLVIEFERTTDILRYLGEHKLPTQVLVGFAAETENLEENAMRKVISKNLDFIVANNVALEGAGFGTDTNIVSLYDKNGLIKTLPQLAKREVADCILDEAILRSEEKVQCMPKL